MNFVDGYIGLLASVSGATFTEFAGGSYGRQPVRFSSPVFGLSKLARPFSFGNPQTGSVLAGRAVFTAMTGGAAMLLLPFPSPVDVPGGGPIDAMNEGDIILQFAALTALATADAYSSGPLAVGTVLGSVWDRNGIIGTYNTAGGAPAGSTVIPISGGTFLYVNAAPLTVATPITIRRGVLDLVS